MKLTKVFPRLVPLIMPLSAKTIVPTSTAFAPILLYPATEFDSIYTEFDSIYT